MVNKKCRNTVLRPASGISPMAEMQESRRVKWIPAFAGMTRKPHFDIRDSLIDIRYSLFIIATRSRTRKVKTRHSVRITTVSIPSRRELV